MQVDTPDISSGDSPDASGGGGDGKPKHVPRETYEKTVKSERNAKQKLQEAEDRLLVFETEKRTLEESKLLSEKKHVELIEQLKREKDELSAKNNSLIQDHRDARKLNAALGVLQEKGVQLDSKYLGLLPLDQIQFTAEGDIDHLTLVEAVTGFQKEHPRLIAPAKAFLPSDKSSNAMMLTPEQWKALPSHAERQQALKDKRVKY
jgi:hypothetical protein